MSVTTPPLTSGLFQFGTSEDSADITRHHSKFTEDALQRHKREGLELAIRARIIAMAIVAVMITIFTPWPAAIYYILLCGVFVLIGLAQRRFGRVGTSRVELFLLFCDLALLTFIALVPNPFHPEEWPLAFQYRFETFKYFFIILAMATLAYSWRTIFAVGTWTASLWGIGAVAIWYFTEDPNGYSETVQAMYPNEVMRHAMDPTSILVDLRIQEAVVFLIVAVTLGISVRRSNNLLLAQAAVERERANLARYFSPNVVDQLSTNDDPLRQVNEQHIAVLFVDIVGFTTFAANRSPAEVIRTLREFHEIMEREVFQHDGTLDKYLGDGLMATFGTPFAGDRDALNALRCARAMAAKVDDWNANRTAAGQPAIKASFGLHSGPVVLGDIGANRLEFAVIGNTVNIASRLEALTRTMDARIVASDALIAQVRDEAGGSDSALEGLAVHDDTEIRGVEHTIRVWTAS